jgi:fused signal recognition particle receptor
MDSRAGIAMSNENASETRERGGWFTRLRDKFSTTPQALGKSLSSLLRIGRPLDQALLDEIEATLLKADIGVDATEALMAELNTRRARNEVTDTSAAYRLLRQQIEAFVQTVNRPLIIPPGTRPFTVMVVGVNGVGKTTTIGKLAHRFRQDGRRVMLAAGDTFRAAAIEQLKSWGERNDVAVIAQHTGADAAAVAHDAMNAAQSRGIDVLIVDTAGRQHTHAGLMDELKKIRRVLAKSDPNAPHEVLMVLDAGTGQNALSQLKAFRDAVNVTGLVLTKLDGTAKGGIVVAIAKQAAVPIRYLGVGEDIDDLQDFDATAYAEALLPDE